MTVSPMLRLASSTHCTRARTLLLMHMLHMYAYAYTHICSTLSTKTKRPGSARSGLAFTDDGWNHAWLIYIYTLGSAWSPSRVSGVVRSMSSHARHSHSRRTRGQVPRLLRSACGHSRVGGVVVALVYAGMGMLLYTQ